MPLLNNQRMTDGSENTRIRRLALLVVCGFFAITVAIFAAHLLTPESQQSKYIKSATAAARKRTPKARVKDVKVADGFAIATVTDQGSIGQARAGNTIVFSVNKDGSMTQIADGSSFSPLDLLELGIPLATQAKLVGSDLARVKEDLATQCGYYEDNIGFVGFNGSFDPDGWNIDSGALSGLEQKLSQAINSQNFNAKPGKEVICVSATKKDSDATTDNTTYISTFKLKVEFVTNDGALTTHAVTFAVGPNYYRAYTLDGNKIM